MYKCETCCYYTSSKFRGHLSDKCPKCKRPMKPCSFKSELLMLLAKIERNTQGGG